MIEDDTIKLLRECDAGIEMGLAAFREVLDYTGSAQLKQILTECQTEHRELKHRAGALLAEYHDDGKSPNPLAQGMSWLKTGLMLAMDESDQTIAELMTDGGNMGVQSLTHYLNQYPAANEKAKALARSLIDSEERLVQTIRPFL